MAGPKLLFLDEAVEFTGEEALEFRAARTAGGYRVESVIFLAEAPEVEGPIDAARDAEGRSYTVCLGVC